MITKPDILIRSAMSFAIIKIMPNIFLSLLFVVLAWQLSPLFLSFSLAMMCVAYYRLLSIRCRSYEITPAAIRIGKGIFLRRVNEVKMFHIKNYSITQPIALQVLKLMNLTLKTTNPKKPVIILRGIPESDLVDIIGAYVTDARKCMNIAQLINN